MLRGAQRGQCSSTHCAVQGWAGPRHSCFHLLASCVWLPGNFLLLSLWFPFVNLSRFLSVPPGLAPPAALLLPRTRSPPRNSCPEAWQALGSAPAPARRWWPWGMPVGAGEQGQAELRGAQQCMGGSAQCSAGVLQQVQTSPPCPRTARVGRGRAPAAPGMAPAQGT